MHESPRPLSARFREATAEDHRRAERRPFVQDLLRGRLGLEEYVWLLRDLVEVYEGLERGLEAGSEGLLPPPLASPALKRAPALEADLRHLHGRNWRRSVDPSPAALAYGAHLRGLARTFPRGLAAHAYVRYLGDLSGGRLVGRQVQKAFGLDPDRGLAFYAFPAIEDVDAFKARFRAALDRMDLQGDGDALVEEARHAFDRNGAIFDELQRRRASRAP